MDALGSGAGLPSFWQVGAALVTVLALLVLALKLLGRCQRRPGAEQARLLQVRRLGPRRELEVLLVDDEVYTIYRHDGGLAVLKHEPEASYAARRPEAAPQPTAAFLGRKLLALAASAGGSVRSVPPR
ncbi:MAG: hypothetical protein R3D98_14495 [Candidatus Krumholzibacteriia bacterium]